MKKTVSWIALLSLSLSTTAYASGVEHYNGSAGTRGFVSKSGFVKERTNEENHMDGKEVKDDAEPADGDVPADASDKDGKH